MTLDDDEPLGTDPEYPITSRGSVTFDEIDEAINAPPCAICDATDHGANAHRWGDEPEPDEEVEL